MANTVQDTADAKPYEWAKMSKGQHYVRIAKDLGRAIFAVDWPKHTLPLMYLVMEESWDFKDSDGEPKPVTINFFDLAEEWGVAAQRLYEARSWLVSRGIWIQTSSGYLVSKDADQWGAPDVATEAVKPILSEKRIAYAKLAKTEKKEKSDKQSSCTPQRSTPQRSTPQRSTPERLVVERPSVQSLNAPACNEADLHYKDRVRGIEIKEIKREEEEETPAPDFSQSGTQKPRTGDDARQFNEALQILDRDIDTSDGIGLPLSRNQHADGIRSMEGWRFLVAARRMVGGEIQGRMKRDYRYFLGIARKAEQAELDPPKPKFGKPKESPTPATNIIQFNGPRRERYFVVNGEKISINQKVAEREAQRAAQ